MNDLNQLVPQELVIVFPRSDDGQLAQSVATVTVTLSSLNLPEFLNVTGAPWNHTLHRYEYAAFVAGTWINHAVLTSLAKQFATDWYRWQLGRYDVTYAGIVPWNPEGLHDVEWRSWVRGEVAPMTTHVSRQVFNPKEDLLYQALAVVGGSSIVNNFTVINELNVYNIVNFYNTTINLYYTIINWTIGVDVPIVTNVCHFTLKDWVVGESSAVALTNNTKVTVQTISFTLQEQTTIDIRGYFDFNGNNTAVTDDEYRGTAFLDGTDLGPTGGYAVWRAYGAKARETVAYEWPASNVAAGSHTVLLKAWRETGTGQAQADAETKVVVEAVPVIVVEKTVYNMIPGTNITTGPTCTTDPQNCCPAVGPSTGSSAQNACLICQPGSDPTGWSLTLSGFFGCGTGGGGACDGCLAGSTPGSFTFTTTLFTGDFSSMNGAWTLTQLVDDPCTYFGTLPSGASAVLQLVTGGGEVAYHMVMSDPTGTHNVVYDGQSFSTDCCVNADLFKSSQTGHGTAETPITAVPVDCGGGSTCDPNGDYTFVQLAPCIWVAISGNIKIVLTFLLWRNPNTGLLCVEVKLDIYCNSSFIAEYVETFCGSGDVITIDCCTPISMNLVRSECTGEPGTIRINPIGCGSSSSSSSSGSSSSSSGASVPCCPDVTVPLTLKATFTGGTGSCTCMNGDSVTLTNPLAGQLWNGTYVSSCAGTSSVGLGCNQNVDGTWSWTITSSGFGCIFSSLVPMGSVNCSPFDITLTDVDVVGCCTGKINIHITPP